MTIMPTSYMTLLAKPLNTSLATFQKKTPEKSIAFTPEEIFLGLSTPRCRITTGRREVDYEVKISKGFTELKPSAYTVSERDPLLDFHQIS